ncbi:MAG: NAD-binding protein [Spirochaetes bacterium]|nr:NAD-binding protein [Spirochaetota bacterium]
MKISIRGVSKFFSALLRRLIQQRAPTVSEEQAGEDFVIPDDTRVLEETVPSVHRPEKKERRSQKRKRITFLELWEVMNSNNTLTFFLIVVGLLAFSAVGAFIFEAGKNQAFVSFWDIIWWTVVTITTVGYGDKFPVTLGGKLVGILIMALGVATVGIVTGRIASFLVNKQIKARGGLIVVDRRKGHFIICGWKEGLETILENILKVNPQLRPSNIVLINDADPEEIDHIRSIPQFRSVKYIKGDYIDEKVLGRANLRNASTALVLADSSRNFSVQEVDSRTVMAVITIDSMNKNIYTCAELLDEKFEKYLKLANCDEIILSREHSRILIANAASASGISHIASELLLPTHGGLLTEEIPSMLVGRTFLELQEHYRRIYGDIVIGVLENTGKLYYRKREALAEAQKTPDISKLIENLQGVKRLVPNKPLLNPGDGYVIKKNTRAIIVTGRREGSEEREEKAANE